MLILPRSKVKDYKSQLLVTKDISIQIATLSCQLGRILKLGSMIFSWYEQSYAIYDKKLLNMHIILKQKSFCFGIIVTAK